MEALLDCLTTGTSIVSIPALAYPSTGGDFGRPGRSAWSPRRHGRCFGWRCRTPACIAAGLGAMTGLLFPIIPLRLAALFLMGSWL